VKRQRLGVPSNCETTAPWPIIFGRAAGFGRVQQSMPEPSTAIVRPPRPARRVRGGVDPAARARLTIVTPRAASSPASDSATSMPYAVAGARADDRQRERVGRVEGAAHVERRRRRDGGEHAG